MSAITIGYKTNFQTLLDAARNGDLALLDCQDKKTGLPVRVIVALNRESNGDVTFAPLAKLFDGNPYEELNPPNPDGGYFTGEGDATLSKFPLGKVVITAGAAAALSQPGTRWTEMLARHHAGDWGELAADDRQMNDAAIDNGDRILSAYRLLDDKPYGYGNQVWIITEADRSATTILLPEEY